MINASEGGDTGLPVAVGDHFVGQGVADAGFGVEFRCGVANAIGVHAGAALKTPALLSISCW